MRGHPDRSTLSIYCTSWYLALLIYPNDIYIDDATSILKRNHMHATLAGYCKLKLLTGASFVRRLSVDI
jgi:hypothetical protein